MLNKLRHEVENTLKSTLNKITSFQDYLSTYSLVSISFDAHRDHVDNMLKKKKSKKRKVDDDFIKLTGEPQNKNNNKPLVAIVPSISVKPSSTSVEEGEWNKVKSKRRIKTSCLLYPRALVLDSTNKFRNQLLSELTNTTESTSHLVQAGALPLNVKDGPSTPKTTSRRSPTRQQSSKPFSLRSTCL